ncbi:Aerobic respiration control sensor protein ArcB [compost metagenome]
MQNASLHGKATTIKIAVRSGGGSTLSLELQDDGLGFQGSLKKLGSEILISADSRGNGIGLLLTRRLLNKMNGDIRFESQDKKGFTAIISIPGGL